MANKVAAVFILALLFAVGIVSLVKPLLVWDIGWGWWLKVFGDVRDKQKVRIIRAMGILYLLLLSFFFYDFAHRLH